MHEQRGNFCIFLLKVAEKEGKPDLRLLALSRVRRQLGEPLYQTVRSYLLKWWGSPMQVEARSAHRGSDGRGGGVTVGEIQKRAQAAVGEVKVWDVVREAVGEPADEEVREALRSGEVGRILRV